MSAEPLTLPGIDMRMTKSEYMAAVERELIMMRDLIAAKNNDYTGGSAADDPFANFRQAADFGVDPLVGLNIRMGDKFQRIKAFSSDGKLRVPGESVADAYRDLIGYSLLALGMLAEGDRA